MDGKAFFDIFILPGLVKHEIKKENEKYSRFLDENEQKRMELIGELKETLTNGVEQLKNTLLVHKIVLTLFVAEGRFSNPDYNNVKPLIEDLKKTGRIEIEEIGSIEADDISDVVCKRLAIKANSLLKENADYLYYFEYLKYKGLLTDEELSEVCDDVVSNKDAYEKFLWYLAGDNSVLSEFVELKDSMSEYVQSNNMLNKAFREVLYDNEKRGKFTVQELNNYVPEMLSLFNQGLLDIPMDFQDTIEPTSMPIGEVRDNVQLGNNLMKENNLLLIACQYLQKVCAISEEDYAAVFLKVMEHPELYDKRSGWIDAFIKKAKVHFSPEDDESKSNDRLKKDAAGLVLSINEGLDINGEELETLFDETHDD